MNLPAQQPEASHAIVRAEIDSQVATAKAYPRDIKACSDELRDMVCMDLDTAESCMYSLPRDGKAVTGPSVRLAEMAVSSWGNVRAGWRVVSIDAQWVECEGVCHDLQKNVVATATAKRSIVGRSGKRYSENMIQTTVQACGSIAYRNAVFKAIPAALVRGALEASQQHLLESIGDYKDKIPAMVQAFAQYDVTESRLCRYFRLDKIGDMTAGNFLTCRGIFNAIKAGESVAGDYFGKPRGEAGGSAFEVPDKPES